VSTSMSNSSVTVPLVVVMVLMPASPGRALSCDDSPRQ
jgi:hypothetical protein